jgi:hypothetical protein
VFIPRLDVIGRIDRRHPDADLLCGKSRINHFGELKGWEWWTWVPGDVLPLPWASAMVCAARMSARLLSEIDRTVVENADRMMSLWLAHQAQKGPAKYLFIEFLFTTLALHHRMKMEHPPEFATVFFNRPWRLEEMDDLRIYHPVKAIGEHDAWRAHLAEKRRQATS